jgi:hypothetical protein
MEHIHCELEGPRPRSGDLERRRAKETVHKATWKATMEE